MGMMESAPGAQRHQASLEKKAVDNLKKEKAFESGINKAGIELAKKRFSERINSTTTEENQFQTLSGNIGKEINTYLSLPENANLKSLLYDEIAGMKDTQKLSDILSTKLIGVYTTLINKEFLKNIEEEAQKSAAQKQKTSSRWARGGSF